MFILQVLSANTEHFAQVEGLFEDQDFKVKVSRELIEQYIKELRPRLTQPLHDALKTIDFKPEQVETIVLMGAGTRIPVIQQIVKDYFGGYVCLFALLGLVIFKKILYLP